MADLKSNLSKIHLEKKKFRLEKYGGDVPNSSVTDVKPKTPQTDDKKATKKD